MNLRLDDYIESHSSPQPEWLYRLNRLSNIRLLNGRMCSGHAQGRLLSMLTAMIRPLRVLELGTFSGYSALCMAESLPAEGRIDTIEANDELEDFIREGLSLAPKEMAEKIRLHFGPALKVMEEFGPETFDLVFIDADKREYAAYYRAVKPLLRCGGFIIADNTLWDGHVVDPDYDRDRQTRGIREFNDLVAADAEVEKVMVPMRDGLTLIRKT